jgi:voltage-gated potassium channel Kch
MERFEANPNSIRNAARVLIIAIITVVFVASLGVWIFDHGEYPDYGTALWFTLQTVTTVGYGDVPPTSGIGRFVASIVMVCGIATISIVTAIVTSTFYEAAQRERRGADRIREQETLDAMLDRFDELATRLDRIEDQLADRSGRDRGEATADA